MKFNTPRFWAVSAFLLSCFFIQPAFTQCTFSVSNTNPCPGEPVTFTVINPAGGSTYKWDLNGVGGFNDGMGTSVTFTYPYSGTVTTFTAILQQNIPNMPACTSSQTVSVKGGVLPTLYVKSGQQVDGMMVIKICGSGQSNEVKVSNNTPDGNPANTNYSIQWETGGPAEPFPISPPTATVAHTYSEVGFHNITVTASLPNGCILTNHYKCFKGGTPSGGLESDSFPSVLCTPYQLLFRVTNYQNNPPGTTYQFFKNGQSISQIFLQETLPNPFTFNYNFIESTCGQTTPNATGGVYQNATSISLVATNPCDTKSFSVSPIRVVTKPVPDFSIQHPLHDCPNEVFTFMNTSTDIHEIVDFDGPCKDMLNSDWMVSGTYDVDWTVVSGDLLGDQTIKIKFLKHGTYNISMTLNPTPICGPATITKTITILEAPKAIATAELDPTNGCAPLTVKFKNTSTGYQVNYNWHISPGNGWSWQSPNSGTGDVNTKEPTAIFTNPGTYSVTLTVSNVCSTDTWVTQIVVKSKPTVTLPTLGPFCKEATLNFMPPTPIYGAGGGVISDYKWTFPGGTPNQFTGPNPMNIQYGPVAIATPFTYTVSVTNECGTTTASKTFEIQVPATINLPPDITVCANAQPFQITPVSPPNGSWSGNPGVTTGGLFTPANAGGPGDKILTYTYGAVGSACTATKELKITIIALPTVNAGSDLKKCVTDPVITLNGTPTTPPGTGNWVSSPITPGLSGGNFNPASAGAGTFILTYTYINANGCKNSDPMTITVNALPTITASDISFCNTPGLVDLPIATPPGGSWSGAGISNGKFDPQTPGGPTFIATYAFTDPQTFCSNSKNITITVGPPEVIDAGPDKVLCKNDPPFDLDADATNSVNGMWSGTGVSGHIFNPDSIGPSGGTFTIKLKKGASNCTVFDERIITVTPIPVVDVPTIAQSCEDETAVTLPATIPATGGNWVSVPAGLVSGNTFNAVSAGIGDFILTYTYTDPQTQCSNSDELKMTVQPLPSIMANDTIYCNTPGGVNLPFANPPGGSWMGQGISNNLFDPVAAGGVNNYTATYTFTNLTTGCINKKDINIEVINPDNIDAGPDKVFCLNDPPFDLNSDATNSINGNWSGTAGVSGNFFTPLSAGAGTHTITLKKGPQGNCQVVDERIFKVNPLPIIDVPMTAKSCINETAVLLPATTPTTGGVWISIPPGLVSGTVFNAKMAGQGTNTLIYTFTDANNCTNSDSLKMTVNQLPIVAVPNATYCNTPGTVPLPIAAPIGGVWSGMGVFGDDFDPLGAGGVGIYPAVYTFTDMNGCSNRDTASIKVVEPVNINAGRDTALCISVTDFDLIVGGVFPTTDGEWFGDGVSANIFNAKKAGQGTHILTYYFGIDNCRVQDTRTITVNPLPVVYAGPDDKACLNETAVNLSPNPTAGTWDSGGAVLSGNVLNPNASGEGVFLLVLSFTDSNVCKNSDTLRFTVHPLPMPISHDTAFCNTPGLVNLPLATPSSSGMGWWTGVGISGLNFNPQGAGGVGEYPATYHFADMNGCADSITVKIKVVDPVVPNAGVNDTICISDGLLQLSGFSPTSGGNWSGAGIIDSITGLFNPILAGGGLHELDYAFGVGNCKLHDKKTVLVIDVPIEAGPDRSVCVADNPFVLSGFVPSTGGIWVGTGITNSATGAFSPATAGMGEHKLLFEYKDPILGCTFRDSLKVIVHPMPESAFPQPTTTCINDSVFFQNLSQSTFDVLWDFGDGGVSTIPEPIHVYTDTGTFTVKLVTKNEFGCMDMASRSIFVTRPPNAFFTLSPDTGCAILKVKFVDQSTGFEPKYLWKFGNFRTDTLPDPGTVEFIGGTKDTTYYVVLEVKNLCATRVWTDSVLVHPLPIANFGTSTDTICSGQSVVFTNITLGQAKTFEWDFGNGHTSTDSLPAPQQYFVEVDTLPKTYKIRLIATNFCGSDTIYHSVTVNPLDVSAFFNVPNYTGCQPYTVQFTNFATPGATVAWDFGDGNTSSNFNPAHTFSASGVFKVVQKATDGCGFDSTFAFITVLSAPTVSFDCSPQICRNDTLNFTNTSPDALSGVHWNFGDGDTSILYNPVHAYDSSGLKKVVLIGVSAENGCPAPFSREIKVLKLPGIQFSTDKIDGCVPLKIAFTSESQDSVYYEWDFGDSNTESGPAPSHIYYTAGQYEVRLRAIDLNGCRNDTLLRYITAHPIPSPDFEMEREHLCGVSVQVNFINKTPDAVSYTWQFGDGSGTSPLNEPQHEYFTAGDFLVQLIAQNAFYCLDTASQTFSAYAQPKAEFIWTPEKGCAPLEVFFENLSSNSTSAHWFFSDGGKSDSLTQALHTFYAPGKYDATLIVSHREVCFDTLLVPNIVEVLPSPTANFNFAEILTTPPSGMFAFTDLSIDAAIWQWQFGDGDSSDLQNPTHRYFSNGPKTVRLTVWGSNGCPDDTVRTVTPTSMYGLFIPDAFTPGLPNGDASKFLPKGVGLLSYHIAVYSSYGTLLWESEALRNGTPADFWDGTFKGESMPQDVYTWKLINAVFDDGTSYDGKRVGSVTLIR